MCDQGDCQQYFDCSPNDQFENAENCQNCEGQEPSCPPECNQCQPPSQGQQCYEPEGETMAMYDPCLSPYDPCPPRCSPCPPNCDPCPPRCSPCPPNCDPCDPCPSGCPPNCDPYAQYRCNPCEPLGPCPLPCDDACQPRNPCPPECNPMCSEFSRRRYVQPPRRESCRPVICYQPPEIPMTTDTVYRKSFDFIDAQTAAACRMPPVMPRGQLRSQCGDFAKETVTRLSYQPFCCPERTKPFMPNSPSLLGQGPMQGLSTQKHDFVPKFQFRRLKCTPRDGFPKPCGCVERTTIQRLSFMAPDLCRFSRAESCKPIICYKPPETPMEFETTQKLSFMPVCPPQKEEYPWARRAKYCPPSVRFAKDTVAKLSYQPPGNFLDEKDLNCYSPCDSAPRASC